MSNTSTHLIKSQERVPWVDWLRFLAAVMVVGSHARAETWAPWGSLSPQSHNPVSFVFYALTTFGHESVVLFFVLSGFFVGGKIWDAVSARHAFSVTSYAVDRFCRIYMPLLPALVLTWLVAGCSYAGQTFGCMLATQGILTPVPVANVSLWSLGYEVWFYVGAGSLAALILAKSRSQALCAGLILALSALALFALKPIYVFYWVLGAASWRTGARLRKKGLLAFGMLMLAAGFAANLCLESYNGDKENLPRLLALLVMSAGLCVFLGSARGMYVNPKLEHIDRAGTWLASFSYTLYLVHYPVYFALRLPLGTHATEFGVETFGQFAVRISAALAVSGAFYALFERNTHHVKAFVKSCAR